MKKLREWFTKHIGLCFWLLAALFFLFALAALILSLCSFFNKDWALGSSITIANSIVLVLSVIVASWSLYVIVLKIQNDEYTSRRRLRKNGKEIAKRINALAPDYLVIVAGNAEIFFNEYVKRWVDNIPTRIDFEPVSRFSSSSFPKKSYSCPFVITTNKFVLFSSGKKDQTFKFNKTDKVLIMDDVCYSGDTVAAIRDFLLGVPGSNIDESNLLSFAYIVDKRIVSMRLFNYFCISADLSGDYLWPWRQP